MISFPFVKESDCGESVWWVMRGFESHTDDENVHQCGEKLLDGGAPVNFLLRSLQ